jgi:DNA primase
MDAVILSLMGYKGVVANCGGVQSCRQYLKSLLYEVDRVICLYDNDIA